MYLRCGVFRCRACQRMGYLIENQDRGQRLWMKAEKIERQLEANLSRPKGMHQRTYDRLIGLYYATEQRRDGWFHLELLRRFGAKLGF